MREIKFRAWVKENTKMYDDVTFDKIEVMWFDPETRQDPDDPEPGCWVIIGDIEANSMLPQAILMQYTSLKDKNGLADIYEGDIIDMEGNVKGNIYETPNQQTTDFVIEGLGTATWRNTEQGAMERGCHYAE